jgi:carbon monoxide dehydrogenase subunit G
MKWTNTLMMDAPAELIWELNTDVERWPARTPTVQSVERLDDGVPGR